MYAKSSICYHPILASLWFASKRQRRDRTFSRSCRQDTSSWPVLILWKERTPGGQTSVYGTASGHPIRGPHHGPVSPCQRMGISPVRRVPLRLPCPPGVDRRVGPGLLAFRWIAPEGRRFSAIIGRAPRSPGVPVNMDGQVWYIRETPSRPRAALGIHGGRPAAGAAHVRSPLYSVWPGTPDPNSVQKTLNLFATMIPRSRPGPYAVAISAIWVWEFLNSRRSYPEPRPWSIGFLAIPHARRSVSVTYKQMARLTFWWDVPRFRPSGHSGTRRFVT